MHDPYWTTAKISGVDRAGKPIRRGDRVFYYPSSKAVLAGDEAEQASADFQAARQDEAFATGEWN